MEKNVVLVVSVNDNITEYSVCLDGKIVKKCSFNPAEVSTQMKRFVLEHNQTYLDECLFGRVNKLVVGLVTLVSDLGGEHRSGYHTVVMYILKSVHGKYKAVIYSLDTKRCHIINVANVVGEAVKTAKKICEESEK